MEQELVELIGWGTVASLFATAIWQIFGSLSRHIRTPIEYIAGHFGGGVRRQFADFNAAVSYVERGLKSSKEVKFLAIRGFLITHEENAVSQAFGRYFNGKKDTSVKLVLADPKGKNAKSRSEEFEEIRKESADHYLSQIENSIEAVGSLRQNLIPDLSLRLHDTPAIYRLMIFDEYCLVSFYSKEYTGLTSPVLLIGCGTPLYKSFDRYFDATWECAKNV